MSETLSAFDTARLRAMLESGASWDHDDKTSVLDEIDRLRAMEQRLKSSFTRGTMDSPWLQRNALHLGDKAVAFMRWVWTGEEK